MKKDEEVCGFVVKEGDRHFLYPIKNMAENKKLNFVIPVKQYLYVEKKFKILAIYHSHIEGDSSLSELDKKMSEAICYPFLVYSKADKSFTLYEPELSIVKKEEIEPFL
jgi:proteasome lid subunit RPN8/RPN11